MATRPFDADVFDGGWQDVSARLSIPVDSDTLTLVVLSVFWMGGWGAAMAVAALVSAAVDVAVLGTIAALPVFLLWGSR